MDRRILYLLIIYCTCGSVYAQQDGGMNHVIDLRFGINQIKDQNLHSKTSRGTITELTYGFEIRKDHWQQFNFTLGYSRLKTELEDVSKTANLKVTLGYAYTLNVIARQGFQYFLGPDAALAYSASYFPNWDESHIYWANYISAGIRNNFVLPLKNQKQWITSLSVPVLSFYSRPELYRLYKIDDTSAEGIFKSLNGDIKPGALDDVFYVKLNTELRFPVFRDKIQAFSYHLDFLRVKDDDSNAFNQIIHQVGITIFL